VTVIVCREGFMAADTAGWDYDGRVVKSNRRKIVRLGGLHAGSLFAACGELENAEALIEKLNGGDIGDYTIDDNDFCAIEALPDGTILRYLKKMRPVAVNQPFIAIGANESFLYGALYAGASAEDAVRLAIRYTDSAGGDVQVEHI
jgi:hypothetical protein